MTFRLSAGTFLVDGGDNTLVPGDLTTDFLGNPRFADELTTPDTGIGGDYIVDYGAIEAEGDSDQPGDCPADLAAPFGVLDLADVVAFVSAFTAQEPAADLNGDGLWDLADVTGFVTAFTAGCP